MNIKSAFYILLTAGFLNLLLLDSSIFFKKESAKIFPQKILTLTPPPNSKVDQGICPYSCVSKIQEATAAIKLQITPSSTPVSVSSQANSAAVSIPTESYIPLGSGSNSTDDWADLPGVQANVDSTKYGNIKNVFFEATVRIPTGNETAYVRLYNATDKHPVWFSDVSLSGGTPSLLTSQSITLDPGNKLYQVQMKTSLKYQAILDQSRIHIASQ